MLIGLIIYGLVVFTIYGMSLHFWQTRFPEQRTFMDAVIAMIMGVAFPVGLVFLVCFGLRNRNRFPPGFQLLPKRKVPWPKYGTPEWDEFVSR